MTHEVKEQNFGENPLGSWNDLKPSFSKQVRALLKKNLLIRCRNVGSIIEIVFAFIIPLIALLDYFFAETKFASTPSPSIKKVDTTSLADWFLVYGKETKVACLPDKPLMHYLIGNTTFLKTAINGGTSVVNGTTKTFPGTELTYVNQYSSLKEIVRSNKKNNMGIEWENIDSPKALTRPSIKVYLQSSYGSPQPAIYFQIRDSLATMRSYKEGNASQGIKNMKFMNITFSESEFAHPQIIQRMTKLGFGWGLLSPISIILATLPDMELIFFEKDVHITALSFLMGMTELAYWFTNFIVSFIICFVVYLYISLIYAFWYGLNGNDFGMIFVLSLLFVIAEIWFQFFISTLIKDGSKGKSLTIILIMATIILSFFFQFVTFKEKSTASMVLNNIFCIFPISAYQLFLMQGYIANVADLPLYRWNDMNNRAYICPPWIPFMWSAIDIVIYFVLFVICNALAPRAFGVSTIKLSEIFKRKKKSSYLRHQNTHDSTSMKLSAVEVDHLTKIYHGARKTRALNSVSFNINKGEVIVMIGPNGAGKSTMINCISGGIKPTDGNIAILGETYTHNLGVCYQENVLIPQLSVQEHFELFGAFRGLSKETLQTSIDYLTTNMQLTHMLKNRAGDLSGGQKRKLCIGLSLLGNPEVVLMDEPTAGVDVQACQLIWKMISNLKETTSLITSHALEEAEAVSSRLFILSEGVMRFTGTSTELREQFKCGYELRVETSNESIHHVLEFVKKYIPEAKIAEDRQDVILMPVCLSIGKLLVAFRDEQQELGVISYSFAVQQLEDMLLKSLNDKHED
ncbi:hypothetical protein M9Y10_010840 [Tritrichomonas musculus]|uniref:ABC transporter domain-containing protein n=1 Tax=Tritrichomonas musculus TaxID=1915356 RepID=A0ABR2ILW6_9EUKA